MAIARDPNGNTVIVWESENQDGDGDGIYAQRFAPDGTPLGREFLVNTFTDGNQREPAIAIDDSGNFIIVWVDRGRPYRIDFGTNPAIITDANGIYGRRFASDGTPLDSAEFLIDRDDTVFSSPAPAFFGTEIAEPSVAMDADGDFVVTWQLSGDIWARRFDSASGEQGDAFIVNTFTDNRQSKPDVAMDATGNFVITWQSFGSAGINSNNISARRFDALGNPLGGEFGVNTTNTNSQVDPAIAMSSSGEFVIVWEDSFDFGGIGAQWYNPDGTRNGGEIQVNTDQNFETQPDVAITDEGDVAIVWDQETRGEVYVRTYLASGLSNNDTSVVSSGSIGNPIRPAIAVDAAGNLAVVWTRTDAADGDGNGVFSQLFGSVFSLSGEDAFTGSEMADDFSGGEGDDTLLGLGGSDLLFGDAGADRIEGGDGDDVLSGGSGADSLTGDAGNDTLDGGPDDDSLDGGEGNDRLVGGDGDDILNGGSGNNRLLGDGGNDELIGGNQNDRLLGGDGNDTLTGNNGRDKLIGGNGKDELFGGKGVDRLKGGRGNDLLDGGKGKDILIGGPGRDRFVITPREGRDLIRDFRDRQDKIALNGGLSFGQLTIEQRGRNALIRDGGDQLALLKGLEAELLTAADFITL